MNALDQFRRQFSLEVADVLPIGADESLDDYGCRAGVSAPEVQRRIVIAYDVAKSGIEAERRREKQEWVDAARASFNPRGRGACHVCGRFRSIAQAHHLSPLSLQYDRGILVPDHSYVWLCPNHHVGLHLLICENGLDMQKFGRRCAGVVADLEGDEFDKMMVLLGYTRGDKPV